jgi:uncharacterized protein YlbG (UPF0298 family)
MPEDEINLKSLRVRFLGQYKDEYLHQFYERVYDKYQKELHLKFEPFFEELLKCFQPEKREEFDPELFEFDIMNNICNYLNLRFLIYKLSFEQKISEYGEYIPVALVYYSTQEEKAAKENKLEELSKEKDEAYFIIYLDMEKVKSLIDALMLQPKTIIGMTQSKTDFLSSHYETQLQSLQKSFNVLEIDAEHGKKFKGKPLSPENEIMYKEILNIQEALINEFGPGHSSSLSKSVGVYSYRKHLFWPESKIKSTTETVRILRERGRI